VALLCRDWRHDHRERGEWGDQTAHAPSDKAFDIICNVG
jgi:hypothetical protein